MTTLFVFLFMGLMVAAMESTWPVRYRGHRQ
jgi:hypothetical protein